MMKKVWYKSMFVGVLLCSLFMAACSNESEEGTQKGTAGNGTVSLFMDYETLKEVTIMGADEVKLKYTNEGWVESNGETIDQEEVTRLITEFVQLTGIAMEPNELKALETQEPFMAVTLLNELQEEKTVELLEDENGVFYAKESEELVYAITQLPDEWQQFSLVMVQAPIEVAVDTIDEIHYTQADSNFTLNQKTTLSDVEASPFISGWFLHSDLQTEFSVEYNQMDQLLVSLTTLKGQVSEAVEQESFTNSIQIELTGEGNKETLTIGSEGELDRHTYVKTESNQLVYEVPDVLIRNLTIQPLKIVDNFISLLPLTAIESIEIKDGDNQIMIEASHDVVENDEKELEVTSEFFVNDEQVDTEAFKKTYQYIALLSYEAEVKNYSIPAEEAVGEISLVYTFKDNGETLQHNIRFIPYEEGNYVVVKDDQAEFTAAGEQIETMLQQLTLITTN